MKKLPLVLVALPAIAASLLFAANASANTSATSQVRITGLGFASLGAGAVVDDTPGFETITLGNYAYSAKNLKGYTVKDTAGNVVPLCALNVNCTSTVADHDADGVVNMNDSQAWLELGPRMQKTINLEIRNDGPLLNNGGDTVALRNSVGTVLSIFRYAVSNPTS